MVVRMLIFLNLFDAKVSEGTHLIEVFLVVLLCEILGLFLPFVMEVDDGSLRADDFLKSNDDSVVHFLSSGIINME